MIGTTKCTSFNISYVYEKTIGLQCKGMGETRCSKGEINDRYANLWQILHISGQREIRHWSPSLRRWNSWQFHQRSRIPLVLRGITHQRILTSCPTRGINRNTK